MKKIVLILITVSLSCISSFAWENGNRDEVDNIVRGPYVHNTGFFDNAFVELQGGVNVIGGKYMGRGNGYGSIMPALGLGINFGKWFNPNFGLRIGWQGVNTRYLDPRSVELNSYNYTHADFLVNISNWFSGYKETRFWDFVPYLHVGWINTTLECPFDDQGAYNTAGAGFGLLNTLRLSSRVRLSIDLRQTFTSNSILGKDYIDHMERSGHIYPGDDERNSFWNKLGYAPSAMVGLQVTLGKKTGWKRADSPLAAEYDSFESEEISGNDAIVAAQDRAEAAVKASVAMQKSAADAYLKASEYVDARGNILPAAYKNRGLTSAEIARYTKLVNNESCPDFIVMGKASNNKWDKEHSNITPNGWSRFTGRERINWMEDRIFSTAETVLTNYYLAENRLVDANRSVESSCEICDESVRLCEELLASTSKKIDADGNVLPACYPDADRVKARKFCEVANNSSCPDFSTMSSREIRKWTSENVKILPYDWRNMNSAQKTIWVKTNIFCPAEMARKENSFAEDELAKAKARKQAQDEFCKSCVKPAPADGTIPEGIVSIGYFTIGNSFFNEEQMANWENTIAGLDKKKDYVVIAYTDKGTGSAGHNAKLRQERCEYVRSLLIKKGFTGNITARPAESGERVVLVPEWKNRSVVIR